MHRILMFMLATAFSLVPGLAQNLSIYYIDMEGGAATLLVAPAGESILVDTGHPMPDDRDAKRIHQVATKQAGLAKIDYLLTTHFHRDHFGGLFALAKMIPIGRFFDHGDTVEQQPGPALDMFKQYLALAEGKRTIVKPGDKIPLKGLDVTAVAGHRETISTPINGGGPNEALCRDAKLKDADPSDNAASLGFLLSYNKFQFLDLGDLTWNIEHKLACPQNLLGKVDLYQVTHHGLDRSGPPELVLAIQPQVAIMNNGPRKGGPSSVFETLRKVKGIEDIWQVHRALPDGYGPNAADELIANMEETEQCKGNWLKVVVDAGGKYTITNGRNGFSKSYMAR
jgi:beta-lactamase superfamily II metal-dependent hydrolase